MGNNQSLQEQIQIYKPPTNQLVLIDPGISFRIYQHRHKLFEVMAHKMALSSSDDLKLMLQNFIARYQHHYFVSTVYLKCEDYSTCGGYIEAVVFYQRIFTNLSKIKDIPIHDALHFYAVAFKGFEILYRRFGYFEIYEDMFFLTQDSKLKVWCNKDISKNQPEQYLRDKTGKEQDMVRKIIFLVGQNTDPLTDQIQLRQRLLATGVRNFEMALLSLREICRQFSLTIPERVQCMIGLPSQQVRSVLDQYATSMRKVNNNNQIYSGYKMESGQNNPLAMSNINNTEETNGVYPNNSPQFVNNQNIKQQQESMKPIDQQFFLPVPQQKNPFFPPQSLSPILPQSPMLHTFNKYPQNPQLNESRKGIDLSLSQKKNRASSVEMKNAKSGILSGRNNRSQNNKVNNYVAPSFIGSRNSADDYARKNGLVDKKNGIVNTQANDLRIFQNGIRPNYPFQVNFENHQFAKPTIQARPNQKFYQPTLNGTNSKFNSQPIKYPFHSPQFIQKINNNNRDNRIYHSQSSKPIQKIVQISTKKPSILKHQSSILLKNVQNNQPKSQSLKKNNTIHFNFTTNNNNDNFNQNPNIIKISTSSPTQYFLRPSVKFAQNPKINVINPIRQKRASSRQKNNLIQKQSSGKNIIVGPFLNAQQIQSKVITNFSRNPSYFLNSIVDMVSLQSEGMLKRNASTPVLGNSQVNQNPNKSNPFELVENLQDGNRANLGKNHNAQKPQLLHLNKQQQQSPFYSANSTSSRYVYSTKQLNDNIPNLKYYKKQSPKKQINKLFDTKIQQLQSFNESRFGTINSLKSFNNDHSQVIQIIGRDKKDSITSAFNQQQKYRTNHYELIKNNHETIKNNYEHTENGNQNDNEIIKFDNVYKNSDSFTDPKILQILKRPSSKALKNELNILKKTSKTNKNYQFSRQLGMTKPQIDHKVRQDFYKFSKDQQKQMYQKKQVGNQFDINERNLIENVSRQDFQGFPSLSNLSQINKLEENSSFNQQRSSPIFNNSNNRRQSTGQSAQQTNQHSGIKKSRFSEQHGMSKFMARKQQPVAISEFNNKYTSGNNGVDGPNYEYSFSNKKQIPIQDNEWQNQHVTSTNNKFISNEKSQLISTIKDKNSKNFGNIKEDSTLMNSRSGQFKVVPQKPYNFIEKFNSNQSLASLQFQLSKKLNLNQGFDSIKQEKLQKSNRKENDQFYKVRVSSAQKEMVSNRKYKPSLDPQIGRDLERFRKQRNEQHSQK